MRVGDQRFDLADLARRERAPSDLLRSTARAFDVRRARRQHRGHSDDHRPRAKKQQRLPVSSPRNRDDDTGSKRRITMASPASVGGHPIHPMIIPFPIALWAFSLIADVIYLWRGNPVWRDWIAFYVLLAGIIGAALAAVFGIIDWLSIKDPAVKKVADWHARLNVIALLIFAASFYLRTTGGLRMLGGSYTIPLMLSVLGVILITISGYLAGERASGA